MNTLKTTSNFSGSKSLKLLVSELIATELGLGRAAGRLSHLIGCLPGIILFYLTRTLSIWAQIGCFFLFVLVTIGACEAYVRCIKENSPDEIVLDGALGMWAALFYIDSADFTTVLTAFVIYRLLANYKPFPINVFKTFSGGIGIAADDFAAGMVSNFIVRLLLCRGFI